MILYCTEKIEKKFTLPFITENREHKDKTKKTNNDRRHKQMQKEL
jgi:hypothetical protein